MTPASPLISSPSPAAVSTDTTTNTTRPASDAMLPPSVPSERILRYRQVHLNLNAALGESTCRRVYLYEERGVIHKIVLPGQGKWPALKDLPSNPLDHKLFLPPYREEWLRYEPSRTFWEIKTGVPPQSNDLPILNPNFDTIPQMTRRQKHERKKERLKPYAKVPLYEASEGSSWIAAEFLRHLEVNEYIRTQRLLPGADLADFSNLYLYLGCEVIDDGLVFALRFEQLSLDLRQAAAKRKPLDWNQVSRDVTLAIHQLARIGVIYTDMRTPNIMWPDEGWKLIDYGDCIIVPHGEGHGIGEEKESGEAAREKVISEGVKKALEKLEKIIKDQGKSDMIDTGIKRGDNDQSRMITLESDCKHC